jgi:DNA-binding transcriptional MocR family regulator
MNVKQSINFLRGVPAQEALSCLIPMASEGYEKVIRRYGTDVLQYGHFTGFKPLRDLIGSFHRVHPERVIVGNGGLEIISFFFKSLPGGSNIIVEEASLIESAKRAGVGIAAAWNTIPPSCEEETRKKGLFIRLTFPAYEPDKIEWGISKLKETAEGLV